MSNALHLSNSNQRRRVAVVGAGGYSGAEAVGLLLHHPFVDVVGLFGSAKRADSAQRFDKLFPRYRGWTDLTVGSADANALIALEPDAVILATPHEASHDLAPSLCDAGIVVFDLSAAFRLKDPGAYATHYGFAHAHHDWLRRSVYGLAEVNRAAIATAELIAVPGCYPTSVILPLRPLVAAGVVAKKTVIVDSTSGVSGAGRSPALKSLLCEVSQQPYGVLKHRHQPEMIQEADTDIIFTPHLGPFDRGILSTIHISVEPGTTRCGVQDVYESAYSGEQFIRILDSDEWPSVAAVESTNRCDIAFALDSARNHLVVCSAIDNLVKGAAGQAIQCFNIRFGFPEATGFSLSLQSFSNHPVQVNS